MVQSKYQSVAKQKSQETSNFSLIIWNAGGLNEIKILELENLLFEHDPDAFVIIDAGGCLSENDEKLSKFFKKFQIKTKKRDRKTSSGMILGVRKELTCKFRIEKEIECWSSGSGFNHNLQRQPEINMRRRLQPTKERWKFWSTADWRRLPVARRFQQSFHEMGICNNYKVGRNIEDFIDTHPLERINSEIGNDFTFLSSIGSKTSPDLVLAHSRISRNVKQSSIKLTESTESWRCWEKSKACINEMCKTHNLKRQKSIIQTVLEWKAGKTICN